MRLYRNGRAPSAAMRAAAGLLVGASALTLAGCMGGGDQNFDALALAQQTEPADVLYNQGLANLDAGRLGEASAKFEAIDRQHPYSEYARRALIMRAFTAYRGGEYEEAVTSARRYASIYPASSEAAYAQYIVGLSYFRQMPDVTRDQAQTARASNAFQELIDRYPDSPYVEDSRSKQRQAQDQLAGKEMQVGRYYLERREYIAAINRFRNVVDTYPQTRHVEEALARLTEAYLSMGLRQEAQASASVLGQNFPESQWYADSYRLLQTGGLQPAAGSGWFSNATRSIIGTPRAPAPVAAAAAEPALAPPPRA